MMETQTSHMMKNNKNSRDLNFEGEANNKQLENRALVESKTKICQLCFQDINN